MRYGLWITVLTVWTGAHPALAQQRPEVLVLGVYHMDNPGRDVFNIDADDVLSPRRQAEIAELVEVLARFQPTRIAVEAGFSDDDVVSDYRDFLAGDRELTRNEVEQIGFRLARQLGHDAVYPVDVDGEFPFPRLADYARAHGETEEFDALMAEIGAQVETVNEYLASHTILETLVRMNSDDQVAADVGFYYRQVRFGEAWNWAGADLLSAWFHRNIRIHSNVVDLLESPDERVLVVFGAGHLGWLRQNVAADPELRLRKLSEFIE